MEQAPEPKDLRMLLLLMPRSTITTEKADNLKAYFEKGHLSVQSFLQRHSSTEHTFYQRLEEMFAKDSVFDYRFTSAVPGISLFLQKVKHIRSFASFSIPGKLSLNMAK